MKEALKTENFLGFSAFQKKDNESGLGHDRNHGEKRENERDFIYGFINLYCKIGTKGAGTGGE